MPAAQVRPGAHALPQAPQFEASAARSAQTPLQLARPAEQATFACVPISPLTPVALVVTGTGGA
jgi:hypothetical protein